MRLIYCLPLIFLSCTSSTDSSRESNTPVVDTIKNVVPMSREKVSAEPVRTYTAVVPDELNDFEFAVRLYETPLRFRYRAEVRYKMIDVVDSVDVPNLGYPPQVDVRKLDSDLSCMIGFLDKEGEFRDLKKVEVVNNQLKIRQVKRYGLGVTKKVVRGDN